MIIRIDLFAFIILVVCVLGIGILCNEVKELIKLLKEKFT